MQIISLTKHGHLCVLSSADPSRAPMRELIHTPEELLAVFTRHHLGRVRLGSKLPEALCLALVELRDTLRTQPQAGGG